MAETVLEHKSASRKRPEPKSIPKLAHLEKTWRGNKPNQDRMIIGKWDENGVTTRQAE
jgi:hypothetical protein